MGKPRMIILIRHAQSEGNKNREIHQTTPDHRVKLTPEGWAQADEAGRKLRSLLRSDDTLHFFTSPYRRTRETTEGILNSLTSDHPVPSPFPRHTIKVYEEPRLREQDFGNFQPDSSEMAQMWRERAEYGHFFYRIPNGESAADAYDRVSGFNESLWRSFGEDDFASVSVLVTHGLMTRVFLMKWYHFSVEYFEDLRNVEHCEIVVMKLNPENGKYVLQNQLRTWSQLKKDKQKERREREGRRMSMTPGSPTIPMRKQWNGCFEYTASNAKEDEVWRQRQKRQNTADLFMDEQFGERVNEALRKSKAQESARERDNLLLAVKDHPKDGTGVPNAERPESTRDTDPSPRQVPGSGRDFGGSWSGTTSPGVSQGAQPGEAPKEQVMRLPASNSMSLALKGHLSSEGQDRARADALGDQSDAEEDEDQAMEAIEKLKVAEKNVDGSVR